MRGAPELSGRLANCFVGLLELADHALRLQQHRVLQDHQHRVVCVATKGGGDGRRTLGQPVNSTASAYAHPSPPPAADQGESNALTATSEAAYYKCALPFLVASLRALFNSPSAHAAVVQLAPWASSAAAFNGEVAALRQAQLEAGDPPGAGISVITAVDGGDPYGPIGSIHPRAKKPVGDRLGAALLSAVYGAPTPFAGPRLRAAVSGGGAGLSATLTFAAGSPLVLIPPTPAGRFAKVSMASLRQRTSMPAESRWFSVS